MIASFIALIAVFLSLGITLWGEARTSDAPPLPAAQGIDEGEAVFSPESCLDRIEAYLAEQPALGLTYRGETDEIGSYGMWRLEGIAGRLDRRLFDLRGGPVFDVLKVHLAPRRSLWAAVGVSIPPYYFVHDSQSLIQYRLQGHGDQPYYLSYVSGMDGAEEVLEALRLPGAYRVSLSLSGPYVSRAGIDWAKCLPAESDACLVGAFVDRLMPSGNGTLLETGWGSPHPLYGFITFQVALLERVDLCAGP